MVLTNVELQLVVPVEGLVTLGASMDYATIIFLVFGFKVNDNLRLLECLKLATLWIGQATVQLGS